VTRQEFRGITRRGILYISRRKHFENYILFQHAHRICMTIVLILSISAILNSQNWSVVRIVSSHTVPNFWPWDRDVPTCPPPPNFYGRAEIHSSFGQNIKISENSDMSGKVFVCLRKLWDREDFVICQGKIFWLPPPPLLAKKIGEKY
jgi:hypothetical protein